MVDSIGGWSVGKTERVAPVRAATPVAVAPDAKPAPAASPTGLVKQLAGTAPVDLDHVARIKNAIANGTFPIQPATVADRLLALKLNWRSDDPRNDSA